MTQTNSTEIATTILNQLGRMALAMMGAKQIIICKSGISFRIGRNAKSVNVVVITLDPSDTYTVEFIRTHNSSYKTVASVDDVYADCLHQVIESNTGLYLSL